MNEGGRTSRPGGQALPTANKAPDTEPVFVPSHATEAAGALSQNRMAGVMAERYAATQEGLFVASNCKAGIPPMARIDAQRRRAGADASRRLAVMRKASAPAQTGVSIPAAGQPLPEHVRGRMEQKIGADLSQVTVNTGAEASRAASQLGREGFHRRHRAVSMRRSLPHRTMQQ